MTLLTCPKCKHYPVSASASGCPKCGADCSMRHCFLCGKLDYAAELNSHRHETCIDIFIPMHIDRLEYSCPHAR